MLRRVILILLLLVMLPSFASSQEVSQSAEDQILRLLPQKRPSWILPQPAQEPIPKNLVELADSCLGQYGCLHKWLHKSYSVAFEKIGCHCYTGRCRPTTYKTVPVSDEFPMGIAVLANDRWCPVTAHTLRRNDHRIPEILRQFKAHVCVSPDNGCAELECAILGTDG